MHIRDAAPEDDGLISQVIEDAFGQSDEADLVDALCLSGDTVFSLVADDAGEIVGQILLSKLQAPEQCLALAPVSVLPNRQNQGIGSELIQQSIVRAKTEGWLAIFLLGEPAYYERFGFTTYAADKFETEYPKSYFMALELSPNALAPLAGRVTYPSAFLSLG